MRVAAIVAIGAMMGATAAQSATPRCVPPAELEALAVVLLPDAVQAVGLKCATSLPATATLRSGLTPLVTRWREEAPAAMAGAAAAISRFGSAKISAADAPAMLTMMRGMMIDEMIDDVSPATCAKVERAITLAAPLPARNVAGLFVMAAQLGGRSTRGIELCPEPR